MVRVLAFDPGMVRMGFAIVDYDQEIVARKIGYMGRTPREDERFRDYLNSQIYEIAETVPRLVHLFQPTVVAMEIVPPGKIGSNTEKVTAAATVVKVICNQFGLPLHELAANTVKKEVTGDGNATKAKIRNALIERFPAAGELHKLAKKEQRAEGEKTPGIAQDAFDGLAIAIAFLYKEYGDTIQR